MVAEIVNTHHTLTLRRCKSDNDATSPIKHCVPRSSMQHQFTAGIDIPDWQYRPFPTDSIDRPRLTVSTVPEVWPLTSDPSWRTAQAGRKLHCRTCLVISRRQRMALHPFLEYSQCTGWKSQILSWCVFSRSGTSSAQPCKQKKWCLSVYVFK